MLCGSGGVCLLFLVGVLCVRGLRLSLFGDCFALFMCHVGPKYTEAFAVMACCVWTSVTKSCFKITIYQACRGAERSMATLRNEAMP